MMNNIDGKRIAIVDDDPLFLEHLRNVLLKEGGVRALSAVNGAELFRQIEESPVSCIVLDYDLGIETGLALGQEIKQKLDNPPPIVMLTGAGSEKIATKAFRIGFSDYVMKRNLDTHELLAAVGGAISQRERENMQRAETAHLRENQRVDSLTGLYTSAYIKARLEELVAGKPSEGFTLLAIEIEGFSLLRSHLGHAAAERSYRDFAHKLSGINTGDSYLGHLGTRTLACLYERQLSASEAEEIVERLEMEARTIVEFNGSTMQLLPRVKALYFPEDANSIDAILEMAIASKDEVKTMPAAVSAGGLDRREAESQVTADPERRMEMRRKDIRHRVLKRGKIIFEGLNTVIDCTVRNVSASGASLRVAGYFAAPARFKLQIIGSGEPRLVVVRWQIGGDIGVEFQDGDA